MCPRRSASASALLLFCSALGPACTGERVVEHVDQPHRVEIIRDTRIVSGGWHVPLPARRTTCFVRVYLDQKCELALPCDSPAHDLRAFPERSLVAFRLGDPWHAIRFVGSRAFYDCRPALGNGPEPDLRRLGSLADAADRIRSCVRDSDRFEVTGHWAPTCGSADELIAAIRETAGRPAIVASFDRWARVSSYDEDAVSDNLWAFPNEDAWSMNLRGNLMAGEKSAVAQGLCPVLGDPKSDPRITLRAAQLCPIDASGVAEAALARFKAHLALPEEHPLVEGGVGAHLAHMVFSWSAMVAARSFPKEAGQAACALITTGERGRRERVALAAVAATKARCPAVLRHLEAAVCPREDDCPDAGCDSTRIYAALERWLTAGPAALQDRLAGEKSYLPDSRVGLLIAAARHLGPLPKWVGKRIARRSYAAHETDAPSCAHSQGARGEPCACEVAKATEWFCSLPVDGSYGRLGGYNCEVRADDAKKVVGFSRRLCLASGDPASCIYDADCCLGSKCVWERCK
jgi:hypothetical protein